MAKKKKAEPPENHERWLLSYADFMTLLFALFVVLYGFAMSKQTEVKALVQGLIQSFTEMGFVTARPGSTVLGGNLGIQSSSDDSGISAASPNQVITIVQAPTQGGGGMLDTGQPPTQQPLPTKSSEMEIKEQLPLDSSTSNSSGAPFESLEKEFNQSLEELVNAGLINIKSDENWLTIELSSGLIFPSGSATILLKAKPILNQIAKTLAPLKNYVRVRGYTDNIHIGNELYASNWELSAYRAISVLNSLSGDGIPPAQLAIEAYGEFSPFASNSTERGREVNRKVVIAVSRFAYTPKTLPVIVDETANQPGTSQKKPEASLDNYDVIQLPDGRFKLKKQE
ncbi:MAG: OmpA family protein [Aeromonadaceae bacterium]|nr:OmpA family protein [Aeromonadaceae bacterium]